MSRDLTQNERRLAALTAIGVLWGAFFVAIGFSPLLVALVLATVLLLATSHLQRAELAPHLRTARARALELLARVRESPHRARRLNKRAAELRGQGRLEDAVEPIEEALVIFRRVGITFAVYGAKDEAGKGTERLIPFDLIPRVIPAHEWREMERGLSQRVTALNRFIHDVYHDQEILKAGVVPTEQVIGNAQFRNEMRGVDVPGGIYSHIAGIDIVRVHDVRPNLRAARVADAIVRGRWQAAPDPGGPR